MGKKSDENKSRPKIIDNHETFDFLTSRERKILYARKFVVFVCFANAAMLLSYALDFHWWENHSIVTRILMCTYIVAAIYYMSWSNVGSAFRNKFYRMETERDFYMSSDFIAPPFAYSINTAQKHDRKKLKIVSSKEFNEFLFCREGWHTLRDGDFIKCEGNNKLVFFKFKKKMLYKGKGFGINDERFDIHIQLSNIANNEILYSDKEESAYDSTKLMIGLEKYLSEFQLRIVGIYNRYGDPRWFIGEYMRPNKLGKVLFSVASFFITLIVLIIIIAPVVPVLKHLFENNK